MPLYRVETRAGGAADGEWIGVGGVEDLEVAQVNAEWFHGYQGGGRVVDTATGQIVYTAGGGALLLYRANQRDGAYVPSGTQIAQGLVASRFYPTFQAGWPLDRALRAFITAPKPDGLNSTFEQDGYPAVFDVVLDHIRSLNRLDRLDRVDRGPGPDEEANR
jgi:hypothetical protein